MSLFLSKVGRFSAKFRWLVILGWIFIFAALIAVFAVGSNSKSTENATISVPDTQASLALERMNEEFPAAEGADGSTLQLVFSPDSDDVTDKSSRDEISGVIAQARDLPGVEDVSDPFDAKNPYVSEDKTTAVATLTYGELTEDQQEKYYEAALGLQEKAASDLGVELGGNLVPLGAPEPGMGEGVGVLIAFVVLALTFGSLLAAGANLLIAVFGVGVGLIGILAHGSFFAIGENTIILAAMLGLAVGIDYSLFVLSRFRNELRSGRSVDAAVARSTGTAGTAVVFAGLTVVIALVALVVANLSYVTEMGIAAAVAVTVSVLLALTLLPALMKFLGLRALSPRQRRALARGEIEADGQNGKRGILTHWAGFVTTKPVIALVVGVLLLVVVALPMTSMKTASNVPGGADPSTTERAAYNRVLDEFGGVQSPLIVLVEGENVAATMPAVQEHLAYSQGVKRVMPAELGTDGTIARITVIPEDGPISDSTKDLVKDIRDDADAFTGLHLEVTGEAAMGIDQDAQLMEALVKYVVVIVLISILLLMILFRSLLIPVIATLGYLLSVGASFGASVAVFQWGWLDAVIAAPQGDPMLSLLPLLLVGVLFGLAMDYQVFLVSRIQEMRHEGLGTKEAIRAGVTRSGPVLVAAATIMLVVFGGFATSSFAIGASIAFGLLVGVAADAFIVRLVLMPALLSLLGEAAWWMPKWLDSILPSVDVEGHALDRADAADADADAAEIKETGPVLVG